jgi:hypothetical protein
MKTQDIIKWVAIAGAAYLVFRYLQAQGMLGGAAPKPKVIEPPKDVPKMPADFAAVTRDALYAHAQSRMPAAWDGRLTVSEWNWMVSSLTGVQQQRDLPGGADPIYAEDYLALRKTAGISGLAQAFGAYQMSNGWAS